MAVRETSSSNAISPPGTRVALEREAEHIVHTLDRHALRHAPDGSAVKVGAQKTGGVIAISVINEGPGLRDEDLPRLFQQQMPGEATSRTNGEPRSGKGLYLEARQAQWLGGSLSYTSAQPSGVCFVLNIPDTRTAAKNTRVFTMMARLGH